MKINLISYSSYEMHGQTIAGLNHATITLPKANDTPAYVVKLSQNFQDPQNRHNRKEKNKKENNRVT